METLLNFVDAHPYWTAFVCGVVLFYGWLYIELRRSPTVVDEYDPTDIDNLLNQ